MKFGTRCEPQARLGVDSGRVGSEGNIKWQQDGEGETAPAVDWAGEPARRVHLGTGLRVTCRTDWSFLAPYQGGTAASGSVAVATDVADGSLPWRRVIRERRGCERRARGAGRLTGST
jgi:hypothetical protein